MIINQIIPQSVKFIKTFVFICNLLLIKVLYLKTGQKKERETAGGILCANPHEAKLSSTNSDNDNDGDNGDKINYLELRIWLSSTIRN